MEKTMNSIYGKFLGYPECCIEEFGDVAIPFLFRMEITKKASVNGFLPCPSCAQKLLDGKVSYEELINPNRRCSVPFKIKPTPEDDEKINEELNFLTVL